MRVIKLDRIIEALKQYERDDCSVNVRGLACEVLPIDEHSKIFKDEFKFGNFVLNINDLIEDVEIVEEVQEEDVIENTSEDQEN